MHLFAVEETAVRACPRLGGLEDGLRFEFVPPMVIESMDVTGGGSTGRKGNAVL
jgi:hypothetical protein